MSANVSIQKNPSLPPGMDYGLLRRTAMQYLEQLGSDLWTDFNIHDPGITIMEALSFALSDLSYRCNFPIEDLIALPPNQPAQPQKQAFFTAREVLTNAAWTIEDYRKLLVDIDGIKNGWLSCKACACNDLYLYANCKESKLQYLETEHQVIIKGLYDVMIEFEDADGVGDLNTGRLKYNFSFKKGVAENGLFANASLELRLPTWQNLENDADQYRSFKNQSSRIKAVEVLFISGNKEHNQNIAQADFASALRKPLYVTLKLTYWQDANVLDTIQNLILRDVPLLVWFHNDADRKTLQLDAVALALSDSGNSGILPSYLNRIHAAERVIQQTRLTLNDNRNLCEDFCTITAIAVQDVAICADMDVEADADIEEILGTAYFLISQYMSPDIKFWSLKELLDQGERTEDIFDGPQLHNGFINKDQLAETSLKSELHSSDVINLLMDIPGVRAIRNFVFSPFSKEGKRQTPQSWLYKVPEFHQPRLYMEASKVLVFKNGLPFLPDQLELSDTIQVVRGNFAQPKYALTDLDLPVPSGMYQDWGQYQPVQYDLPQTYGVGIYGLPLHANKSRRAKAKQLKAYLQFFEQMLGNFLEMIRNASSFLSIDQSVKQSYFSKSFGASEIAGLSELYSLTNDHENGKDLLQNLVESPTTFTTRRNKFLDHLLARFGEQFTSYTLMLYSYTGNKQLTDSSLIKDKISFLKALPLMSSNRGKSFNYKNSKTICKAENTSGLEERIKRILGFKGLDNLWELYEERDEDGFSFERRWRIRDEDGKILLSSRTRYIHESLEEANALARIEIKKVEAHMSNASRYDIHKSKLWVLNLRDENDNIIATRKEHFSKRSDAEAARDHLIAFATKLIYAEKIFVVEHLLLRPLSIPATKLAQDESVLPICIGPACAEMCEEEDPYSFRFTLIMNGTGGFANSRMLFRRYAEKSIRMEVPAHLALKICWVNSEMMMAFEEKWCAYLHCLAQVPIQIEVVENALKETLLIFKNLHSSYPPASLHDCEDGNDENRVFLNQTLL